MKINLKISLIKRLKNGYPIIVDLYHNGKRKYISFGYFTEEKDWDKNKQMPLPSYPDYEYLLPTLLIFNE